MDYDYREKKIVAVLNAKLDFGVALNVLGHLSISIGYNAENHMGRLVLVDGSGVKHLGISKYPFIITKSNASKIRKAIETARVTEGIIFADYPQQMLTTGHDDELAESLKNTAEGDLSYLGAVFYGNSDAVDLITKKFSLYR